MPAPHTLLDGRYAKRLQLKAETKLALQRHPDSQPETSGITVPDDWYKLSRFPQKLGIRMVATTKRGRKTLQAMKERPKIKSWLCRTHHEWKACLENGDIKAVLAEKEKPAASEHLAPKSSAMPIPHTLHHGHTKRFRSNEESKVALQRHLDSQRETRGVEVPRYWCNLSKLPEKLGIRMVATTARGVQTLEAITARPRFNIWRQREHRDWKACLEYGDIRAVIAENEEQAAEEEEAVSEQAATPRATRQARSAAVARAAKAAKKRRWTRGVKGTTGGEENTLLARRVTRAAIRKEVMLRAMSEEVTEDEEEAEVKVEDGQAQGYLTPGATLGPDAQRADKNNVTDQPRPEERRSKRLRTQGNRQIGFGLLQNRAQFPPPQNGGPQTDSEAYTEAARSRRCMFSVEVPVLIPDTIVVGGPIGSAVPQPSEQPLPSPLHRPNKRPSREDIEVQSDRQIEAAHQDANAIVGAVRTIGSELSAVIMASRVASVPVDAQNMVEGRLVALEQGQRRLEGMMQEMLGYVRPAPQLQL